MSSSSAVNFRNGPLTTALAQGLSGLVWGYGSTIFLAAFLLFQVQPLIAHMILPWFGGSAAVWTTCLLFFQLLLLLGYLYANWLVTALKPNHQAVVHSCFLIGGLLLLPILPSASWKPTGAENPTLHILGLLGVTVGLPYFLLSATSPLLQAWYARTTQGTLPYRLYALSNFASLLALLSYPVLVEPLLTRRVQALMWSWTFGLFVVLCLISSFRSRNDGAAPAQWTIPRAFAAEDDAQAKPAWTLQLLWMLLAACASTLLLAVTNFLSQDIASIPFLWVLPLSLYLFSFVLCFGSSVWYRRTPFLWLLAAALGGMSYVLSDKGDLEDIRVTLLLFGLGFFICCMVCHGELVRLKPAPRHLTSFYVMISLGGALGGVFVGVVAPHAFSGSFEFPIALVACAALALAVLYRDPKSRLHQGRPRVAWVILTALALVLLAFQIHIVRTWTAHSRLMVRNFYGRLWVGDEGQPAEQDAYRKLRNGVINHGEQFLQPARRRQPTTYYCRYSGIGLTLDALSDQPNLKVGIIGLGAGTLAAYSRHGDDYRFYEINPLVIRLANTEFTFLQDSAATVEIVQGDARLSLEHEPNQNFDVLAVDAFTSDSIPVHLLTQEAFALYFRHLKSDGVLAVHVSNHYLDLAPIAYLAADYFHRPSRVIDTDDADDDHCFGSKWVLITTRPGFFEDPDIAKAVSPVKSPAHLRMWTDDYSNLYQILR